MINLNENQNYYIQRISKRHKENFERDYGSSAFFSLDYMGSAEYEFGAVADTFKFLREHVGEYEFKTCDFKVDVFGKEEVFKLFAFIPKDATKDKEQKQIFDNVSIGQKVMYPYFNGKQSLFEEGEVIGFNEDSITVKRFNKKLRFHWRQVIFTK